MTPAVRAVERAGCKFSLHRYKHNPASRSYGLEAAEKLGLEPARVFKTLVVKVDREGLGVALVPVSEMLNFKRFAESMGGKRAQLAPADAVQRATGYVLGGVSPLGQKRRMPMLFHDSMMSFSTVYISAGKRGLDMEIALADLLKLTDGKLAGLI